VKPRVREKTWQDYEGMLRRYIRPHLGETVLAAMRPLDLQTTYQQMIEWGLSARTVRYTHVVLRTLPMVSKSRSSPGDEMRERRASADIYKSCSANSEWPGACGGAHNWDAPE